MKFSESSRELLTPIVRSDFLHAKWLNTLSYLENCGARKIAACEHPTYVRQEMLKHAAEEFRHAHYLKRQISRVWSLPFPDYSPPYLLGGVASLHYLKDLDLKICRYLIQSIGLDKRAVQEIAYLLVTYAIELRAEELYSLYDETLRREGSKVTVKSIFLEEKEHLKEMEEGLSRIASGFLYAEKACAIETVLCKKWMEEVKRAVFQNTQ